MVDDVRGSPNMVSGNQDANCSLVSGVLFKREFLFSSKDFDAVLDTAAGVGSCSWFLRLFVLQATKQNTI